jgi:hypothetical protein
VSQFDYYLAIILLGLGNLALAAVAYRQRDKQIEGNGLRETQVELAELRNEMAQRRMEYLRMQVGLLQEIRDALASLPESEPFGVKHAARSSHRDMRPRRVRTSVPPTERELA